MTDNQHNMLSAQSVRGELQNDVHSNRTDAQTRYGLGALLVLCMAQFMLVLDVSIVNVALPRIQTDLHFSRNDLQLVVSAYALTFGGLLLLGGRVSDLLGRRRTFAAGLVLFTLASLACGLAQSSFMMIVARAVQGIGGALVSPAALSLLITLFPEGKERNQALGIWSALAAGGGAAGLLLGGVLTQFADWRWIFLINVFLGTAVIIASFRVLPTSQQAEKGRIDVMGALTITTGLIALVYGVSRGGQLGFNEGFVLLLLGTSLILLMAFIVIEWHVHDPLVPFDLFRLPTLTGANLATLLLSAVILGVNYFLTLYFQQVLAYSPLVTGVAFLPITLMSALASGIAARLVGRVGVKFLLLVGMLALVSGSVLLGQVAPQSSYLVNVLPGMLLIAIGLGFGFTVGTLAATAGVPAEQQGVASGILSTSQQIGGAVGLAVLTIVASAVTKSATGSTPQILTDGFKAAFLGAAGFALVATLVVGVLMRTQNTRVNVEHQTQAPRGVPVIGNAQTSACQPAITHIAVVQSRTRASL